MFSSAFYCCLSFQCVTGRFICYFCRPFFFGAGLFTLNTPKIFIFWIVLYLTLSQHRIAAVESFEGMQEESTNVYHTVQTGLNKTSDVRLAFSSLRSSSKQRRASGSLFSSRTRYPRQRHPPPRSSPPPPRHRPARRGRSRGEGRSGLWRKLLRQGGW